MLGFGIKGGAAAAGFPKKPTAPTGLSADVNTTYGNAILSWTAPVNTGFPTVTSYTVEVVGVTTINTGNASTSYTWTGGTKGTAYNFKVYANNSAGQSPASAQAGAYTIQGNVATGGSVSDVANYNGTGQTWRVHRFDSSGTLSVSVSNNSYRYLVVAGGGGGEGTATGGLRAGGAGGVLYNNSASLSSGSHAVTVGLGGARNASGQNSVLGTITAYKGQGYFQTSGPFGSGHEDQATTQYTAGQGNPGSYQSGFHGGGGGAGSAADYDGGGLPHVSNITGTSLNFAAGGSSADSTRRWTIPCPGAGGHGNGSAGHPGGGAGQNGVVIVSYRLT